MHETSQKRLVPEKIHPLIQIPFDNWFLFFIPSAEMRAIVGKSVWEMNTSNVDRLRRIYSRVLKNLMDKRSRLPHTHILTHAYISNKYLSIHKQRERVCVLRQRYNESCACVRLGFNVKGWRCTQGRWRKERTVPVQTSTLVETDTNKTNTTCTRFLRV